MKIEHLAVRHLTSLADVRLDLTQVPDGLVAITGGNGAGKTTLLEAPLAALYRTLPSRPGELKDYATDKDSRVNMVFAMDGLGLFEARVNIDGIRGNSDAVLAHQQTLITDGKVTTFDAAVRERFPSLAVMMASSVALQSKRGSFVSKKPRDRKDLFAELLGLQAYEAMSQTAKQIAALYETTIVAAQAQRDELARLTDDTVRANHLAEAARLVDEVTLVDLGRETLGPQVADLELQMAAHQDAITAHAAAQERLTALRTEQARLRAEAAQLQQETGEAKRLFAEDTQRRDERHQAARRTTKEHASQALRDIQTRIASNQQLLAQAAQIRAAVATLAGIETREQELHNQIAAATLDAQTATETRRTREARLSALALTEQQLERAKAGVTLIDRVPFGEKCADAGCQFLSEAIAAKQNIPVYESDLAPKARVLDTIQQLSVDIDAHRRTVAALTTERAELGTQRQAQQTLAKYVDKLTVAETRLAELQTATTNITDAQEARLAELEAERAVAAHERLTAHEDTLARLAERERVRAAAAAQNGVALAAAEAEAHRLADARGEALRVQGALDEARRAWDRTTGTKARLVSEREMLERRQREFDTHRARLAQLEAHLTTLQTELVEWQQLQRALGRDGLPVLEMDAAGPRISAFTNDLLTVCFGARFSVELVTQQARASGTGMKESFALLVTDNERDAAVRDVSDLSGGEQVIISEALMNAIALYVQQRTPSPLRTAWRDETTGALDPENAERYLLMLRKVHALGNYHHIFFVTHLPQIAAQADAQIHVANGTARILLPPYDAEVAA